MSRIPRILLLLLAASCQVGVIRPDGLPKNDSLGLPVGCYLLPSNDDSAPALLLDFVAPSSRLVGELSVQCRDKIIRRKCLDRQRLDYQVVDADGRPTGYLSDAVHGWPNAPEGATHWHRRYEEGSPVRDAVPYVLIQFWCEAPDGKKPAFDPNGPIPGDVPENDGYWEPPTEG